VPLSRVISRLRNEYSLGYPISVQPAQGSSSSDSFRKVRANFLRISYCSPKIHDDTITRKLQRQNVALHFPEFSHTTKGIEFTEEGLRRQDSWMEEFEQNASKEEYEQVVEMFKILANAAQRMRPPN